MRADHHPPLRRGETPVKRNLACAIAGGNTRRSQAFHRYATRRKNGLPAFFAPGRHQVHAGHVRRKTVGRLRIPDRRTVCVRGPYRNMSSRNARFPLDISAHLIADIRRQSRQIEIADQKSCPIVFKAKRRRTQRQMNAFSKIDGTRAPQDMRNAHRRRHVRAPCSAFQQGRLLHHT